MVVNGVSGEIAGFVALILRLLDNKVDKNRVIFLLFIDFLMLGRAQSFRVFSECLKLHNVWQNSLSSPFLIMMYPMAQVVDLSRVVKVSFQDDLFYSACKVQYQCR